MLKIIPFFLLFAIAAQAQNPDKPFQLGITTEIFSKELNENRILNIYLPEGYNPSDTARYHVIYLLDGSADEDFIHVAGLVQYYSFEWIDYLPKSILVGIGTVDRRRDFTFPTKIQDDKTKFPTSGHSEKFISFVEKELQPFIDKKFKTTNTKTLIGQSLGGLFATEILFKKPELFTNYIIVSPSLWWNNGSLLNAQIAKFENKNIYIGVGKEGLTPGLNPRVMEVDANLLAEKIRNLNYKNINLYFDYLPEENHATILHPALIQAIQFLKNHK